MSRTGMMQRCWEHDYCAPCFYLITVVTEPRRDGLGVLQAEAAGGATVALSRMGEVVREVWRRTSEVYSGVEACANGRLLMLAPFAYQRRRQTITREQCRELNEWAREIVETDRNLPRARAGAREDYAGKKDNH